MSNLNDLFVSYKALNIPESNIPQIEFISNSLPSIEVSTKTQTPKIVKKADTKQPFSWFLSETVTTSNSPEVILLPLLIPHLLLNTNGWNIQATLDRLNKKASKSGKGLCAGYVWDALAAGGINGIYGHARDIASSGQLEKHGFKPITRFKDSSTDTNYIPLVGDIVVSAPDKNKSTKGHHVAMYNGTQWVSDFKQNKMDVYGNKDNEWIIYRRTV